jgi:hypothetical protein
MHTTHKGMLSSGDHVLAAHTPLCPASPLPHPRRRGARRGRLWIRVCPWSSAWGGVPFGCQETPGTHLPSMVALLAPVLHFGSGGGHAPSFPALCRAIINLPASPGVLGLLDVMKVQADLRVRQERLGGWCGVRYLAIAAVSRQATVNDLSRVMFASQGWLKTWVWSKGRRSQPAPAIPLD